MASRDWVEKDFYRELGVAKDASQDEIKKAYRKIARENHPDTKPGDEKAEAKFKAAGEAYGVLSDTSKRAEYDEARALFAGGRFGGFGGGGGGGFGSRGTGAQGGFDVNDLFGGGRPGGGSGGISDLLGGIFGGMGGAGGPGQTDPTGGMGGAGAMGGGLGGTPRQRRGADVETEVRIDFAEAVNGATLPLRLTSPMRCGTCEGSGAKPGTTPRTCPRCGGAGLVSRSQGAFAFSEPCPDCRGSGHLVDDPCPECGGDGVSSRPRTLTIRVPAGVEDGKRIRLAGKGQPGPSGGPSGDLYVVVHVTPDAVFGRSTKNPDDLTLALPVTYPELVRGATVAVPTLEGRISLKVPPGSSSGRTLRVRGRGVKRKEHTGDLLVTLELAVPSRLSAEAGEALDAYARATADEDPRAHITERAEAGRKEAAS
jgi:molecular chaperone DnaJ